MLTSLISDVIGVAQRQEFNGGPMVATLSRSASMLTSLISDVIGVAQRQEINASMLTSLISDVIGVAQRQEINLVLEHRPFDLRRMLHDATSLAWPMMRAKGLSFSVVIAREVPRHVVGDERRLLRVVLHVIGHAIDSTDEVRGSAACSAHMCAALARACREVPRHVVGDERRLLRMVPSTPPHTTDSTDKVEGGPAFESTQKLTRWREGFRLLVWCAAVKLDGLTKLAYSLSPSPLSPAAGHRIRSRGTIRRQSHHPACLLLSPSPLSSTGHHFCSRGAIRRQSHHPACLLLSPSPLSSTGHHFCSRGAIRRQSHPLPACCSLPPLFPLQGTISVAVGLSDGSLTTLPACCSLPPLFPLQGTISVAEGLSDGSLTTLPACCSLPPLFPLQGTISVAVGLSDGSLTTLPACCSLPPLFPLQGTISIAGTISVAVGLSDGSLTTLPACCSLPPLFPLQGTISVAVGLSDGSHGPARKPHIEHPSHALHSAISLQDHVRVRVTVTDAGGEESKQALLDRFEKAREREQLLKGQAIEGMKALGQDPANVGIGLFLSGMEEALVGPTPTPRPPSDPDDTDHGMASAPTLDPFESTQKSQRQPHAPTSDLGDTDHGMASAPTLDPPLTGSSAAPLNPYEPPQRSPVEDLREAEAAEAERERQARISEQFVAPSCAICQKLLLLMDGHYWNATQPADPGASTAFSVRLLCDRTRRRHRRRRHMMSSLEGSGDEGSGSEEDGEGDGEGEDGSDSDESSCSIGAYIQELEGIRVLVRDSCCLSA
ncbi:unnamed protein product [Closterium sp. Yama58-4]|nr:unnamed protein product [Closterium sp. Yama58-4]